MRDPIRRFVKAILSMVVEPTFDEESFDTLRYRHRERPEPFRLDMKDVEHALVMARTDAQIGEDPIPPLNRQPDRPHRILGVARPRPRSACLCVMAFIMKSSSTARSNMSSR